jgi:hypothetical protein
MTMKQNRQLIAIPNVLRDQTAPNTLSGMHDNAARQPARAPRRRLPVGTVSAVIGIGILVALLLLGRAQ